MTNNKTLIKNNLMASDDGFSLIIIPIIFVLFGMFATAVMSEVKPNQFYFEADTQKTMQSARTSLAAYAHRNYRVPCPALPDDDNGMETALDPLTQRCSTRIGILPYRELGLPESAAKDEWGNYYTYKVNPGFTKRLDSTNNAQFTLLNGELPVGVDDGENYIHEMCRTAAWNGPATTTYIKDDGTPSSPITSQVLNRNILKANFCCASNVSGGSAGTPAKAYSASEHGAKINANNSLTYTFDDDGVPSAITAGIAPLDPPPYYADYGQAYIDSIAQQSADYIAEYEGALRYIDPTQSPDGDGFGGGCPAHGCAHFYYSAAEVTIDSSRVFTDTVTISLADVGSNNWGSPVDVAMDIVDSNGTVIDVAHFVLQLPVSPDGIAALEMTVEDMLSDAGQPNNYNGDFFERRWPGPRGIDRDNKVRQVFLDSKANLEAIIANTGIDPATLGIGRVKMGALYTSLLINEISYGAGGIPPSINDDDLIIEDENDNAKLPDRNDPSNLNAYKLGSDTHNGVVNQSNEAAAYALISHGPDGEGSFRVGALGSLSRQIDNVADALENPKEIENYTDPRIVNDLRKIVSEDPTEKFDDIILWDSQITLYNSLRNGTCETAQTL